jgi:hypothetical protein
VSLDDAARRRAFDETVIAIRAAFESDPHLKQLLESNPGARARFAQLAIADSQDPFWEPFLEAARRLEHSDLASDLRLADRLSASDDPATQKLATVLVLNAYRKLGLPPPPELVALFKHFFGRTP